MNPSPKNASRTARRTLALVLLVLPFLAGCHHMGWHIGYHGHHRGHCHVHHR